MNVNLGAEECGLVAVSWVADLQTAALRPLHIKNQLLTSNMLCYVSLRPSHLGQKELGVN